MLYILGSKVKFQVDSGIKYAVNSTLRGRNTIEFSVSCLYLLLPHPRWGARGIVFDGFLCLFLCQQDYEKTAGPICMKFSGKVWSDVTTRRPDYILGQFGRMGRRVKGQFVVTGHSYLV